MFYKEMPFFLKLDGYVARNFKGQMSSFGTFLDPLADKVMMTVMFTTLSMANIVPGKLSYYIEMKKMYTQLLTINLREAYSN